MELDACPPKVRYLADDLWHRRRQNSSRFKTRHHDPVPGADKRTGPRAGTGKTVPDHRPPGKSLFVKKQLAFACMHQPTHNGCASSTSLLLSLSSLAYEYFVQPLVRQGQRLHLSTHYYRVHNWNPPLTRGKIYGSCFQLTESPSRQPPAEKGNFH
jgi:hypothetical protein